MVNLCIFIYLVSYSLSNGIVKVSSAQDCQGQTCMPTKSEILTPCEEGGCSQREAAVLAAPGWCPLMLRRVREQESVLGWRPFKRPD